MGEEKEEKKEKRKKKEEKRRGEEREMEGKRKGKETGKKGEERDEGGGMSLRCLTAPCKPLPAHMHTPHFLQGDVSQWLDDQSHGHSAAIEEIFGARN